MPSAKQPLPFEIRAGSRELLVKGAPVPLGARAFDVLAYLHTHSDRVVSKQELLDHVWAGTMVEEGNLTVQISALRKALGARAISTVPGVGYKLIVDAAPTPLVSGPALPDTPSLVVLPFANMTAQSDNDYLVDGIVSDLIAALTRVAGLFVIAATSSFRYKGQAVDLADVGRELGVRYVLEGSIQQAGDTLRITPQLVEAETGRAIWSERFTGKTSDIFELQDSMTERVAAAIEPTLRGAEALRTREKPTQDLRAYDLCLQAEPLILSTAANKDFTKAIALLDRAIALDPGYGHARALRCWAYVCAAGGRFISWDEARVCVPDARALLESGAKDPLTLTYAGHALAFLDKAAEEGLVALRKAKAMNPNSVTVLCSSGWLHAYVGDFETALEDVQRALRLNPLDPNAGFVRSALGPILIGLGRLDEAVAVLELSHHEAPGYGSTTFSLLMAYWAAGRPDDAKRMADLMLARRPDWTLRETLRVTPFKYAPHRQLFADALRGCGIPEG